MPLGASL